MSNIPTPQNKTNSLKPPLSPRQDALLLKASQNDPPNPSTPKNSQETSTSIFNDTNQPELKTGTSRDNVSSNANDSVNEEEAKSPLTNSGRKSILLFNPVPRKKKGSAQRNSELESPPSKRRPTSTMGTQTMTSPDEHLEFKDYAKKIKGKSLKDRVEHLGNTVESTFHNEIEDHVAKLKEEILNSKRHSKPKVYEIHLHGDQSDDSGSRNNSYRGSKEREDYDARRGSFATSAWDDNQEQNRKSLKPRNTVSVNQTMRDLNDEMMSQSANPMSKKFSSTTPFATNRDDLELEQELDLNNNEERSHRSGITVRGRQLNTDDIGSPVFRKPSLTQDEIPIKKDESISPVKNPQESTLLEFSGGNQPLLSNRETNESPDVLFNRLQRPSVQDPTTREFDGEEQGIGDPSDLQGLAKRHSRRDSKVRERPVNRKEDPATLDYSLDSFEDGLESKKRLSNPKSGGTTPIDPSKSGSIDEHHDKTSPTNINKRIMSKLNVEKKFQEDIFNNNPSSPEPFIASRHPNVYIPQGYATGYNTNVSDNAEATEARTRSPPTQNPSTFQPTHTQDGHYHNAIRPEAINTHVPHEDSGIDSSSKKDPFMPKYGRRYTSIDPGRGDMPDGNKNLPPLTPNAFKRAGSGNHSDVDSGYNSENPQRKPDPFNNLMSHSTAGPSGFNNNTGHELQRTGSSSPYGYRKSTSALTDYRSADEHASAEPRNREDFSIAMRRAPRSQNVSNNVSQNVSRENSSEREKKKLPGVSQMPSGNSNLPPMTGIRKSYTSNELPGSFPPKELQPESRSSDPLDQHETSTDLQRRVSIPFQKLQRNQPGVSPKVDGGLSPSIQPSSMPDGNKNLPPLTPNMMKRSLQILEGHNVLEIPLGFDSVTSLNDIRASPKAEPFAITKSRRDAKSSNDSDSEKPGSNPLISPRSGQEIPENREPFTQVIKRRGQTPSESGSHRPEESDNRGLNTLHNRLNETVEYRDSDLSGNEGRKSSAFIPRRREATISDNSDDRHLPKQSDSGDGGVSHENSHYRENFPGSGTSTPNQQRRQVPGEAFNPMRRSVMVNLTEQSTDNQNTMRRSVMVNPTFDQGQSNSSPSLSPSQVQRFNPQLKRFVQNQIENHMPDGNKNMPPLTPHQNWQNESTGVGSHFDPRSSQELSSQQNGARRTVDVSNPYLRKMAENMIHHDMPDGNKNMPPLTPHQNWHSEHSGPGQIHESRSQDTSPNQGGVRRTVDANNPYFRKMAEGIIHPHLQDMPDGNKNMPPLTPNLVRSSHSIPNAYPSQESLSLKARASSEPDIGPRGSVFTPNNFRPNAQPSETTLYTSNNSNDPRNNQQLDLQRSHESFNINMKRSQRIPGLKDQSQPEIYDTYNTNSTWQGETSGVVEPQDYSQSPQGLQSQQQGPKRNSEFAPQFRQLGQNMAQKFQERQHIHMEDSHMPDGNQQLPPLTPNISRSHQQNVVEPTAQQRPQEFRGDFHDPRANTQSQLTVSEPYNPQLRRPSNNRMQSPEPEEGGQIVITRSPSRQIQEGLQTQSSEGPGPQNQSRRPSEFENNQLRRSVVSPTETLSSLRNLDQSIESPNNRFQSLQTASQAEQFNPVLNKRASQRPQGFQQQDGFEGDHSTMSPNISYHKDPNGPPIEYQEPGFNTQQTQQQQRSNEGFGNNLKRSQQDKSLEKIKQNMPDGNKNLPPLTTNLARGNNVFQQPHHQEPDSSYIDQEQNLNEQFEPTHTRGRQRNSEFTGNPSPKRLSNFPQNQQIKHHPTFGEEDNNNQGFQEGYQGDGYQQVGRNQDGPQGGLRQSVFQGGNQQGGFVQAPRQSVHQGGNQEGGQALPRQSTFQGGSQEDPQQYNTRQSVFQTGGQDAGYQQSQTRQSMYQGNQDPGFQQGGTRQSVFQEGSLEDPQQEGLRKSGFQSRSPERGSQLVQPRQSSFQGGNQEVGYQQGLPRQSTFQGGSQENPQQFNTRQSVLQTGGQDTGYQQGQTRQSIYQGNQDPGFQQGGTRQSVFQGGNLEDPQQESLRKSGFQSKSPQRGSLQPELQQLGTRQSVYQGNQDPGFQQGGTRQSVFQGGNFEDAQQEALRKAGSGPRSPLRGSLHPDLHQRGDVRLSTLQPDTQEVSQQGGLRQSGFLGGNQEGTSQQQGGPRQSLIQGGYPEGGLQQGGPRQSSYQVGYQQGDYPQGGPQQGYQEDVYQQGGLQQGFQQDVYQGPGGFIDQSNPDAFLSNKRRTRATIQGPLQGPEKSLQQQNYQPGSHEDEYHDPQQVYSTRSKHQNTPVIKIIQAEPVPMTIDNQQESSMEQSGSLDFNNSLKKRAGQRRETANQESISTGFQSPEMPNSKFGSPTYSQQGYLFSQEQSVNPNFIETGLEFPNKLLENPNQSIRTPQRTSINPQYYQDPQQQLVFLQSNQPGHIPSMSKRSGNKFISSIASPNQSLYDTLDPNFQYQTGSKESSPTRDSKQFNQTGQQDRVPQNLNKIYQQEPTDSQYKQNSSQFYPENQQSVFRSPQYSNYQGENTLDLDSSNLGPEGSKRKRRLAPNTTIPNGEDPSYFSDPYKNQGDQSYYSESSQVPNNGGNQRSSVFKPYNQQDQYHHQQNNSYQQQYQPQQQQFPTQSQYQQGQYQPQPQQDQYQIQQGNFFPQQDPYQVQNTRYQPQEEEYQTQQSRYSAQQSQYPPNSQYNPSYPQESTQDYRPSQQTQQQYLQPSQQAYQDTRKSQLIPPNQQYQQPQNQQYLDQSYQDSQYPPQQYPLHSQRSSRTTSPSRTNPQPNEYNSGFNPNDSKFGNQTLQSDKQIPMMSLNMTLSDQNNTGYDINSKNQSLSYSPSRPYSKNDPRYMEGDLSREAESLQVRNVQQDYEVDISDPERVKKANKKPISRKQSEQEGAKLDTSLELNLTESDPDFQSRFGTLKPSPQHNGSNPAKSQQSSLQKVRSLQSQLSLQDNAFDENSSKYPTFNNDTVSGPSSDVITYTRRERSSIENPEVESLPPMSSQARTISFGNELPLQSPNRGSSSRSQSPGQNRAFELKVTPGFQTNQSTPYLGRQETAMFYEESSSNPVSNPQSLPVSNPGSTAKKHQRHMPFQQSFADPQFILPPKPQEGTDYSNPNSYTPNQEVYPIDSSALYYPQKPKYEEQKYNPQDEQYYPSNQQYYQKEPQNQQYYPQNQQYYPEEQYYQQENYYPEEQNYHQKDPQAQQQYQKQPQNQQFYPQDQNLFYSQGQQYLPESDSSYSEASSNLIKPHNNVFEHSQQVQYQTQNSKEKSNSSKQPKRTDPIQSQYQNKDFSDYYAKVGLNQSIPEVGNESKSSRASNVDSARTKQQAAQQSLNPFISNNQGYEYNDSYQSDSQYPPKQDNSSQDQRPRGSILQEGEERYNIYENDASDDEIDHQRRQSARSNNSNKDPRQTQQQQQYQPSQFQQQSQQKQPSQSNKLPPKQSDSLQKPTQQSQQPLNQRTQNIDQESDSSDPHSKSTNMRQPKKSVLQLYHTDEQGIIEVPRSQESSDMNSAKRSNNPSEIDQISQPIDDTSNRLNSEEAQPQHARIPSNEPVENLHLPAPEPTEQPRSSFGIERSKSAIYPSEQNESRSNSQEPSSIHMEKASSLTLDNPSPKIDLSKQPAMVNDEIMTPNSRWKMISGQPFQRNKKKRLSVYHEEVDHSQDNEHDKSQSSESPSKSKSKSSRVHIFLGKKKSKKRSDNSLNQSEDNPSSFTEQMNQIDEDERSRRAGKHSDSKKFSTLKLESQDTSPIGSPQQSQIIRGNLKDYQFNSRGSEPDDPKNRSNLLVSPIEQHQSFVGDYSVQANEFDYDDAETIKVVRSPVRNNANRSEKLPTIPVLADSDNGSRRPSDDHPPSRSNMLGVQEPNKLPSNFSSFDDKTHRSHQTINVTPEISPTKHGSSEIRRTRGLEIDTEDITTDNNQIIADPLMTFDRKKENKSYVMPDYPPEKERRNTLALGSNIQSIQSSEIASANKNSFDSISEIAKPDGRPSHQSHWKSNVSEFGVEQIAALSTDRFGRPTPDIESMKRPSLENLHRSKHRFTSNEEPIVEDEEREIDTKEDDLFDVTLKQTKKDFLNNSFKDDEFMNESSHFRKYIVPKPSTNPNTTTSRSKRETVADITSKRGSSVRSHNSTSMRVGLSREQLIEKELECIEYINDKRFMEAIAKLLELLKLACLSPKDPHSIYINYLIAECYSKMGQPDKAEVACVRSLQIIEETQPISDKYVFLYYYGFLTLLGSVNMNAKRHKEAFLIYEKILEVLTGEDEPYTNEVKIEKAHLIDELPVVQYNMATCLLNMDQYERAIYFYKESSDNLQKRDDKASLKRLISCYKKLGICFERLAMTKEAIIYYRKALEEVLQNDTLSEDLRNLIFIYDQLGQLFTDIKSVKEAIYCYGEALRLKIEYYGMEKEPVAHGFIALAKSYMANKEYMKAFGNFEAGNQVLEVVFGPYTIHSANCYVCMAQIKHRMKDYLESYNLYEAALDVYSNLLGKNHLYTYRIHLNLLYLAFVMKDNYKLAYLEKRLLAYLENYIDLNAFIIYNEAANIFRKNKDYERALNYYFHSIELFDLLPDKDIHYDGLSLVYCNVASTNLLKKNFHESIKFYKIALKVCENSDKADLRKVQINTNIGKIYKTLKNKREGLMHLQEAEILLLRLGKTSKSRKMQDLRKLLDEVQRLR